jgi:hypothetical protein
MRRQFRLLLALVPGLVMLVISPLTLAQIAPKNNQLVVDSFTGIYHLSKDDNGLSLLTTEETIVSNFPSAGFYGLTRAIPQKYQNHNVEVKVLGVADAAGNPTPYKTTSAGGNLVITTGDPSIRLYGSQTIKIRYQTSGVINLGQAQDELLLSVNGRGWDESITKVDATVFMPLRLKKTLKETPACYVSQGKKATKNCEISSRDTPEATVITSKAKFLPAHQALVLKFDFAAKTFTNSRKISDAKLALIGVGFIFIVAASSYIYLRKR